MEFYGAGAGETPAVGSADPAAEKALRARRFAAFRLRQMVPRRVVAPLVAGLLLAQRREGPLARRFAFCGRSGELRAHGEASVLVHPSVGSSARRQSAPHPAGLR